jgi:hypothetical protein
MELMPFTAQFNVTGQPAISLPLYWNSTRLPIGTQLVAAFGRGFAYPDRRATGAGTALEGSASASLRLSKILAIHQPRLQLTYPVQANVYSE